MELEFPGNVGAAARALKGFSKLVLVRPACDPRDPEAVRLASHAEESLAQARIVDGLPAALAETCFSVGTTQRPLRQDLPCYGPEQIAPRLLERAASGPVVLVFGRETSGLTFFRGKSGGMRRRTLRSHPAPPFCKTQISPFPFLQA